MNEIHLNSYAFLTLSPFCNWMICCYMTNSNRAIALILYALLLLTQHFNYLLRTWKLICEVHKSLGD